MTLLYSNQTNIDPLYDNFYNKCIQDQTGGRELKLYSQALRNLYANIHKIMVWKEGQALILHIKVHNYSTNGRFCFALFFSESINTKIKQNKLKMSFFDILGYIFPFLWGFKGIWLTYNSYFRYRQILNCFSLNNVQSWINIKNKKFLGLQQLKMNRTIINFEELAFKVQGSNNFSIILQKQLEKYDLQPYKIQQCEAINLLKIYKNIESKYKISEELAVDENNWNQNERRLFVWYIISYSYFIQLQNQKMSQNIWEQLSPIFFHKKPEFLEFQYLNLLKAKKRISWTPQEDVLLIQSIKQEKPGKWNQISKKMFYISNRTIFRSPKHCRERWLNHLDVNKKHGDWTQQEDLIIFRYVCEHGKRWSKVVPQLNETRTQHMIKNRYNSLISKNKASKKQKEEEIAKRIYKQIVKSIQTGHRVEAAPAVLKNENPVIQQKIESEIGQTTLRQNLPQNQQTKSNFASINYPSNFNIGCYFDYNTMLMMNQLYCNSNYSQFSPIAVNLSSNQQHFLFSKNSSFTPYHQNL